MSDQTVIYRSTVKLCCPCEGEVVMCVDSDLTSRAVPFIEGVLADIKTTYDACGSPLYLYYVVYDDADLADPTTLLVSADISGMLCRGCMLTYVDWFHTHWILGDYVFTLPTDTPAPGEVLGVASVDGNNVTLAWVAIVT